ncbi:hypothetical protein CC86DRAFT_171044 [Ophiobolus disseminans]|uniref:Uncharacterized protein n=1 Tax=Ophiobolus disseminans TaxID=1469910 RepID=A0A6A6ZAP0_9PLEO|nr:hypothetical protein CC86DRAFT_171044 [Ophiobolus disseminans]
MQPAMQDTERFFLAYILTMIVLVAVWTGIRNSVFRSWYLWVMIMFGYTLSLVAIVTVFVLHYYDELLQRRLAGPLVQCASLIMIVTETVKWYSILVTSPPKLVYPAWVSIVLAAVLLSFLPRNQHTELICRYCALSLVALVSAVLFLLLIKANYTALGSLSKKTAVIKYRIFAIFASTIHCLSTTGAIAWTATGENISLRPLIVVSTATSLLSLLLCVKLWRDFKQSVRGQELAGGSGSRVELTTPSPGSEPPSSPGSKPSSLASLGSEPSSSLGSDESSHLEAYIETGCGEELRKFYLA